MSAVILNLFTQRRKLRLVLRTPCQRCVEAAPAHYRVKANLMDMLVCDECADLARELGLPVVSRGASG